jgi:hypothetical protein
VRILATQATRKILLVEQRSQEDYEAPKPTADTATRGGKPPIKVRSSHDTKPPEPERSGPLKSIIFGVSNPPETQAADAVIHPTKYVHT